MQSIRGGQNLMKVLTKCDSYPRLILWCSGARSKGKRHVFYVAPWAARLGQVDSKGPIQARCPRCGEAVGGGLVEMMPGGFPLGDIGVRLHPETGMCTLDEAIKHGGIPKEIAKMLKGGK